MAGLGLIGALGFGAHALAEYEQAREKAQIARRQREQLDQFNQQQLKLGTLEIQKRQHELDQQRAAGQIFSDPKVPLAVKRLWQAGMTKEAMQGLNQYNAAQDFINHTLRSLPADITPQQLHAIQFHLQAIDQDPAYLPTAEPAIGKILAPPTAKETAPRQWETAGPGGAPLITGVDARGNVVFERSLPGHFKPTAEQQKKSEQFIGAVNMLPAMPALLKNAEANRLSTPELAWQQSYYAAKGQPWKRTAVEEGGKLAGWTVDDSTQQLFDQVGAMQTVIGSIYQSGRMSYQLFNRFQQHLTNVGENPRDIERDLNQLTAPHGILAAHLKALEAQGVAIPPETYDTITQIHAETAAMMKADGGSSRRGTAPSYAAVPPGPIRKTAQVKLASGRTVTTALGADNRWWVPVGKNKWVQVPSDE